MTLAEEITALDPTDKKGIKSLEKDVTTASQQVGTFGASVLQSVADYLRKARTTGDTAYWLEKAKVRAAEGGAFCVSK